MGRHSLGNRHLPMFTKYCIIFLIFITVLLCPLNVYGMDGASTSNYRAKSKSIAVNDEQNKNEPFVLFKGFVQIRKIIDGKETLRSAKKNEVFMVIFCGKNVVSDKIFPDQNGEFEVQMQSSAVNDLEKCENGINIRFERNNPTKLQNITKKLANVSVDGKFKKVQLVFAKVEKFDCLIFPDEEDDDAKNDFQVDFEKQFVKINGAKADILEDHGI